MAPTIVYIHGNGNKVREDLLKREWDVALFGREMGDASRMAYWAPLLHPQPLEDVAFDEAERLPGAPMDAAPPPAVAESEAFVAGAVRDASADDAPGAEHLEPWLRGMTYAADAVSEGESAAPPPTSPFEPARFPRLWRTAALRAFVRLAFRDVHAYFFRDFKEPMREVLRGALRGLDGPVVLVGHSLGSIIAYDVLREEASSGLEVPLLVTVGSPLAVPEIQDLVEQPLEVPAGVAAWHNASDPLDLVALDHTIRPEYAPPDRCTDAYVSNPSWNHHGIREYLSTVGVRQPILERFAPAP